MSSPSWRQVARTVEQGIYAAIAAATEAEPEAVASLRNTCHLNIAQAALKLSEWGIARTACEYVLSVDDRPVSVRLVYDWGCWCYLVYKVVLLDEAGAADDGGGVATGREEWDDGFREEDRKGGVKDRSGSL